MAELSVDQYLTLALRKVEVARRHLIELEKELPSAQVSDPASPIDSRAAVEGHADGCVLQAYAAFDTFSCAVALHFGLAQPGRASMNGLDSRLSGSSSPSVANAVAEVRQAVRSVTDSPGWQRLAFYRNLAGHRGVVAQRAHFSLETGFSLRIGEIDGPDPNEAEVLPILHELTGWAEETLPPLLSLVEHLEGDGLAEKGPR